MRGIALLAAFAAFCLAFAPHPASAALYLATVTGEVYDGDDALGLFGGGSLIGKDFVVSFTYDTTLGVRATDADSDELDGGVVSFTLTIGGAPYSFAGGNAVSAFPVMFSFGQAYGDPEGGGTSIIGHVLNPAITPSLSTPFALPVEGYVSFVSNPGGAGVVSYAEMTPTFARIEAIGVPEPATWALMILGFGTAGALLRSRRRVLALY